MTVNQYNYAQLELTRRRDLMTYQENVRSHKASEQLQSRSIDETIRHNQMQENLTRLSNEISKAHYERSDSAALMNAQSNALTANVNARLKPSEVQASLIAANAREHSAQAAMSQAGTAERNAQTNAKKVNVDAVNAQTNIRNAATNEYNAKTGRKGMWLNFGASMAGTGAKLIGDYWRNQISMVGLL